MENYYGQALELIKKHSEGGDISDFTKAAQLIYQGLVEGMKYWERGTNPQYGAYEMDLFGFYNGRMRRFISAFIEVENNIIQSGNRGLAQLQMRSDMGGDPYRLRAEMENQINMQKIMHKKNADELAKYFRADVIIFKFVEDLEKKINNNEKVCPLILLVIASDTCYLADYESIRAWVNDADLLVKIRQLREKCDRILNKCENQLIQRQTDEYWKVNKTYKDSLEKEKDELEKDMLRVRSFVHQFNQEKAEKIDELRRTRDGKIQEEIDCEKKKDYIYELEKEKKKCNLFQGKKKKELKAKIDSENEIYNSMQIDAIQKRKNHVESCNKQIEELKHNKPEEVKVYEKAEKRIGELNAILTKQYGGESKELKEYRAGLRVIQQQKLK